MDCKTDGKFEDCAIGAVPPNMAFNEKAPTEAEMSAANLRWLMLRTKGADKCVLCKAAQELEKKDKSNGWNVFPLVFLALFGLGDGFGGQGMEDAMRAYLAAVDKAKESEQGGEQNDNSN